MYACILLSLVLRCIPHAPNFAPVMATCLVLSRYNYSSINILLYLLASDICQEISFKLGISPYSGLHSGMIWLYLTYLISIKVSIKHTYLKPIMASIVFYFISNAMVWTFSSMYDKNLNGLIRCYYMAVPFFKYSLLSDCFYYYGFTSLAWAPNAYANIRHEAKLDYIRND